MNDENRFSGRSDADVGEQYRRSPKNLEGARRLALESALDKEIRERGELEAELKRRGIELSEV